MHGVEDCAADDVAVRAIERHRKRRILVRYMRPCGRPRAVTGPMTCAAKATPVAEVDSAVQVEGTAAERGAGGVRFGVAVAARAHEVTARRRPMAVTARHR